MKVTRQYKRDVPRKGDLDAFSWNHLLGHVEQRRASMIQHMSKTGTVDGYNKPPTYYRQAIKPLMDELGAQDMPSVSEFRDMSTEEQKRALQRALTHLSNELLEEGQGKKGKGKKQQKKDEPKEQPKDQQPQEPQDKDDKDEQEDKDEDEQQKDQDSSDDEEEQEDSDQEPEESDDEDDSDDDDDGEMESPNYGSGGSQNYGEAKNASLFYVIRALIQKLALDVNYDETEDNGQDRWDVAKVVQAKWNTQRLETARRQYETTVENIYLCLDTSGSVDEYTGEIASMAAGAAGIVHLYTGTEARPQFKVERTVPLRSPNEPFPEWTHQKNLVGGSRSPYSRKEYERFIEQFNQTHFSGSPENRFNFEADIAWWLSKERPPKGSRIIFWGDTQCCYIDDPLLLKRLLRDYKVLWLQSMTREQVDEYRESYANRYGHVPTLEELRASPGRYEFCESIKLEAVGIPVLYGVTTPATIRRSLQLVA